MMNDLYFEYAWNLNQIIYEINQYLKILKKHEKEIETNSIDWEDWDINSIIDELSDTVDELRYLQDYLYD
jgi:hypothetical protein